MDAMKYVSELVEKSREAQRKFERWTQEKVDGAVRAVGKSAWDNAHLLARMAVDETGMGVYEDKVQKNLGKPKIIWERLKGKKSRGIIRYLEDKGLVEVAKPMGVIGVITPTTNPTSTPVHNAMIALKGGNSIIICPHPRAKLCGKKTVDVMNQALDGIGAPKNLVQIVNEPTLEISAALMKLADVCVSTGGSAMVKEAYSSGKPAFGVGQGNVQCLIDRDVDIKTVVPMILRGRTYDNGILCTCEQSVICPEERYEAIMREFVSAGAYYVCDPEEVKRFRNAIFPGGALNRDLVGASPGKIADTAGIRVPENTKLLITKTAGVGRDELLSKEKLFPVLSAYKYDIWENAVEIAQKNLDYEGKGHSVVIHSNNRENIEYAAGLINVSRFVVNQTGSNSLGGSFVNGLNPTLTLGCGSWGNNSISENLWYTHLINVSHIVYAIPEAKIPTDEEVWA